MEVFIMERILFTLCAIAALPNITVCSKNYNIFQFYGHTNNNYDITNPGPQTINNNNDDIVSIESAESIIFPTDNNINIVSHSEENSSDRDESNVQQLERNLRFIDQIQNNQNNSPENRANNAISTIGLYRSLRENDDDYDNIYDPFTHNIPGIITTRESATPRSRSNGWCNIL